jgi:hypothetical protein
MAIATLTQNESGANSLIDINNNFADLDTTKADLASPTFTGTPVLPTGSTGVTQSVNDNSTKLATTAYVDTAVASVVLPDNQLKVTTVTLSSSDILALHTTPKTLVAAPGAGKAIIVDEVIYSFTAGTQYANGDQLTCRYNGDTTIIFVGPTAANINSASSSIVSAYPAVANTVIVPTNVAFELKLLSATAFITGTGTLKVFIKYRIITL